MILATIENVLTAWSILWTISGVFVCCLTAAVLLFPVWKSSEMCSVVIITATADCTLRRRLDLSWTDVCLSFVVGWVSFIESVGPLLRESESSFLFASFEDRRRLLTSASLRVVAVYVWNAGSNLLVFIRPCRVSVMCKYFCPVQWWESIQKINFPEEVSGQ